MSNKEHAFKLVRSGDAVLWAGAGLSLYAGYPKASDLAKLLHKDLTPKQQKNISEYLSLEVLAEEFERAKNRKTLISSLRKAFKVPTSINLHAKIASLPQLRTIITTNYDPLFELAYGDRCQKITNQLQVPSIDERKVQILKIHGDLADTQGLVLTKSDYTNFFHSEANNQLWNVVKERIATKSIIFIGYGFEDPNISFIFEKITDALGKSKKQAFYVAPLEYTPPHKQKYLKKKGISYINSTAETFTDGLLRDIENNIHIDFKSGMITADIYREFLSYYNQAPGLRTSNGKYVLSSLEAIDGELKSDYSFTFKKDNKLAQEMSDFMTGKKFGELVIPVDVLVSSEIKVGGLSAPHTEDGIASWIFRSSPAKEFFFDICGPDGFELNDLKGEIFKSPLAGEVHIHYKNLKVEVRAEFDEATYGQLRYHFVLSEPYARTSDGIQLLTLMHMLHKGERFTAHTKDGKALNHSWIPDGKKFPDASPYLDYFNNLNKIEKHYNFRFQNIEGLSEDTFQLVNKIVKVIAGVPLKETGVLRFSIGELTQEEINNAKAKIERSSAFNLRVTPVEEVELHGQTIKLGFRTFEVVNPYLANYEQLLAGTDKSIAVASKTNQIHSTYSDTQDAPLA